MLKPQKTLLLILLAALLIRIIYLAKGVTLWWDSHVYIGMGKFIFSAGQLGLWENFRPLIHPILIGFFWWIKIDPIIIGTLLDVLFSLLAIYLTYELGKRIFTQKVGLLAALIFALTPIFIVHTGLVLTEPLALVLTLLSLLVCTNKKPNYLLAGVLTALAFLTKFPQALIALAIAITLLLEKKTIKQRITNVSLLSFGFALPTLLFFIFNHIRYGDILLPLTNGSAIIQTAGWLYGKAQTYYITDFFLPNPIYLFYIPALYLAFKQKHKKSLTIMLIPILFALYFATVARKEVRYIVTVLPFLALGAAYALEEIKKILQRAQKPAIKSSAVLPVAFILILLALPVAFSLDQPVTYHEEFKQILEQISGQGNILSTETFPYTYANRKVIPLSGVEFAQRAYDEQKEHTSLIVINRCNLPCHPQDESCIEQKQSFLANIQKENKRIWSSGQEQCPLEIFER